MENIVIAIFPGPVPAAVSQTHNIDQLTLSSVLLRGRMSFEQVVNELGAIAPGEKPWIFTATSAPVKLQ